MHPAKVHALRLIEAQARHNVGRLASRLVRASSCEKEAILAALEFERWLADGCLEVLDDSEEAGRVRL